MLEELTVEAQGVLDEMWDEEVIPFKLNAAMITEGIGEYTIHFHNRRIGIAHVPLSKGVSFKDAVRNAVLERVAKLPG